MTSLNYYQTIDEYGIYGTLNEGINTIGWKNTFSMAGLKVRNRLAYDVSNVIVVFAQSPLAPNIDWKLVDVSSKVNIDSMVEISVGNLKSNEEKTILGEIEYTDRKRGYWQVYFNIDSTDSTTRNQIKYQYAIKTNKAQANPWRQDNGKTVQITIGKYEKEYLVEFLFDSGSAHFTLGRLDGLQRKDRNSNLIEIESDSTHL